VDRRAVGGFVKRLFSKLKITLQQAAIPHLAGFPVRNFNRSITRSPTPQQTAGNTRAVAVQKEDKK